MTSRPDDRVVEAGADLLRISETRVLVVTDAASALLPWEHPAAALCRGLAALGFGEIAFSGSDRQGSDLERLHPDLDLRRCSLERTTRRFDLVLQLGGSPYAARSSQRFAEEQGAHFVQVACAGARVSMRTREGLDDPDSGRGDVAQPFAARIGAGLALQEALIFAGRLSSAASPAPLVEFDVEGDWAEVSLEGAIIDVIGAGGVGIHLLEAICPVLGRGCQLRIHDFDIVAPANLPTQAAFTLDDVGRPKADAIVEKLEPLCDPALDLHAFVSRYEDRPDGLAPPTLRIACPDTFAARKYLNDCALADGIPLVEAGSSPLAAQQRSYVPGRTACLEHRIRDLSARARAEQDRGSCTIEHAFTLPGTNMICGGMLALEALRALDPARFGPPSQGTLTYDARFPQRFGEIERRPPCAHE